MNKIITAGCVAVAAFAAVAMPNKGELAKAQRIVEDMTKADLAAFKAGKKPAKDVAKAHVSLAEKAENQAEKYLLYQGAFKLYARCEEYDLAADALQAMQREVKDVPPEVIAEIVGDELRYVPDDKAPQLVAMLKEAKDKTRDDKSRVLRRLSLRHRAQEESPTEKTRKAIATLFPGWSLDTEVAHHDFAGIQANHRGQSNVVFVHPKDRKTPAIVSRTMKLSDKNPCLFLKVSSCAEKVQSTPSDFLLSVRVNGKDALSNRRICTPDAAPWEDVVVPLSNWRGENVKIEVVFTANGWWYEFPFLARLEVAEGSSESKTTIDGRTWTYEVVNGEIVLGGKKWAAIIPTDTTGNLVIPDTIDGKPVRGIGFRAFCGCSRLTSVTIPTSVTSIGHDAFKGCDGLKTVVIPASVTNIHPAAFCACVALESFSVDWENPAYSSRNGLLCSKDGTHLVSGVNGNVVILASVKRIEGASFFDFKGLKSVTIPNGVTSIGAMAFNGCEGLKSVTIPASVKHIEDYAFAGCAERTFVTMLGEKPDCGKDIFGGVGGSPKLKAIHVPADAKSWAGMKEWQGKPLIFDAKAK